MDRKSIRRIPATEAKTHFGQIVQEVASTGAPVIIQTRGQDQAAIISLHDLQRLSPTDELAPAHTRERVRDALRKAGVLAEPTPEMRRRAHEYDTQHKPEEQEQILSELRGLRLEPSLSDIILESRNWQSSAKTSRKQ